MIKVFHQINLKNCLGCLPAGGSFDNMPDVSNYDIEQSISGTASAVAGAVGLGDGGGGAEYGLLFIILCPLHES